jgi:HlyD family secretion protein
VKKAPKTVLIVAVVLVVAGVGIFLFRGRLFPSAAAKIVAADSAAVTTTKVTRGDLAATISASGQLEPNTTTTIRPDSNMPTRKLVKINVRQGEWVKAGQALAEVDPSGLDFELQSAKSNLEAQRAKLSNLQARPQGMDVAAAEASLANAKNTLDSAQENYDNTKKLYDANLSSKKDLSDAERTLTAAKVSYTSAQLSYQNVKGQNNDADIQAQQSSVASAQSELQKQQLVYDSITIRSPVDGQVAEISVNVGDLISPSTALMTVVDPDPMWLVAQVNENDMVQLKIGDPATIVPSGYPDLTITGKVVQIDLHASVQSNVSVFATTIEVPNRDGKLLWGMNADADITVLSLTNVLTLPSTAVKTSNGASTVTVLDGGAEVTWDVQAGATDGSRTQIVAGLDEGDEVVLSRKTTTGSTSASGTQRTGTNGNPGMGAVFGMFR